jgi:hypothetical protein
MNLLFQVIRIISKVLAEENKQGHVVARAELYASMICDAMRTIAGIEVDVPKISIARESFGAFGYYDYISDTIFVTEKCIGLGENSISYVVAHESAHYVRRHVTGESAARVYGAGSFLEKAAEEAAGIFCGLYFAYGNLSAEEMLRRLERQGHPESILMATELKRLLNEGLTDEFARENADSPFLEDFNADRIGRHIAVLAYAKTLYSKDSTLAKMIRMKRSEILGYAFGAAEDRKAVENGIIEMLQPVNGDAVRPLIVGMLR